MLLFFTICFVTPSLFNFCQKIISFQFFDMGLTSLPPIWIMSTNILLFFLRLHQLNWVRYKLNITYTSLNQRKYLLQATQRMTPHQVILCGRRRRIWHTVSNSPPAYNSIPTQEIVRSLHIHRVIDRY